MLEKDATLLQTTKSVLILWQVPGGESQHRVLEQGHTVCSKDKELLARLCALGQMEG